MSPPTTRPSYGTLASAAGSAPSQYSSPPLQSTQYTPGSHAIASPVSSYGTRPTSNTANGAARDYTYQPSNYGHASPPVTSQPQQQYTSFSQPPSAHPGQQYQQQSYQPSHQPSLSSGNIPPGWQPPPPPPGPPPGEQSFNFALSSGTNDPRYPAGPGGYAASQPPRKNNQQQQQSSDPWSGLGAWK